MRQMREVCEACRHVKGKKIKERVRGRWETDDGDGERESRKKSIRERSLKVVVRADKCQESTVDIRGTCCLPCLPV